MAELSEGGERTKMATRFDKFTIKAQEALQATQGVAGRFGNRQLEPVHLLLAPTKKPAAPTGRLHAHLGVTHEAILKALVAVRGTQRVTDPNPEDKFQALERYARDLTELARRGKLDPVIGRDDEVRRVIQ